MKNIKGVFVVLFLLIFCTANVIAAETEEDEDISKITKEEVQSIIGQSDVTLIDVRYEKNWQKSDMKIAGAVREHPNELGSWVGNYDRKHRIILYCD